MRQPPISGRASGQGRLAGALCGLLVAALATTASAADETDFTQLDLSGSWYVLIHYKDSRSEDKSLEKFKDFAWVIEQSDGKMKVEEYPYVVFDEGSEELRRFAMRSHKTWEPEGGVLANLRRNVDVSSRAMRKKKLEGSVAEGYKSRAPVSSGALTMNFSRSWTVDFSPAKVRLQIVDSLSGGSDMLGEMEEAIVYELTGSTEDGDLIGTYAEGTKAGTVRLFRANERRTIK